MKQLTKNVLKLNFTGIAWAKIEQIEFVFSQKIGEAPLKTALYPSDDTVYIEDGVVGVIFEKEDTTLFQAKKHFYLDTRITLKDSVYNPVTPIVQLMMDNTLFRE